MHTFEVNVNEKVSRLVQLLEEKDKKEMQRYHSCRLVYPMGEVRTLNLDLSFQEQEVPHGALLVLLGVKTFKWDLGRKGQ